MADTSSRQSRVPLVVGAAVAVVAAGAVAVYVMGPGNSNGAVTAGADCAAAVAAAERAKPFARGEVAAFRAAAEPRDLGGLAFNDPDGKPVTLASLGNGASLVNFWATWCVPCRTEMPTLDRLEGAMGGEAFSVVPVNIDLNATARATAFLEEIGVSHLPFYSESSGALFKDLRARALAIGLPTTVLVDGKGCEIGVLEGPAEWDSEDAQALIRAATGA